MRPPGTAIRAATCFDGFVCPSIILAPVAKPCTEERRLCAEFCVELFRPFFGLLNILWCKFEYAFSSDWTELFYVGLCYFGRGACIKLLGKSNVGQRVQNFQPVRFVAVFVCFGFYSNKKAPVFWTRAMETTGIEPVTPCMSSKYSNQLSYASVWNGTIITRSAQFVNSLVKICDLIVIFSRGGADFAEHVSIVLQKLRRSGLCYRISFRFAKRKAVHHKRKGKNGQRQSRGVCKQVCNWCRRYGIAADNAG